MEAGCSKCDVSCPHVGMCMDTPSSACPCSPIFCSLCLPQLVSVLAELGGDDSCLSQRGRGCVPVPSASAKLKLSALILAGSREGFHRAARSGPAALCVWGGLRCV